MDSLEWFWTVLLLACLLWYTTITFYIAFRGAKDIKHMLKKLSDSNADFSGHDN